MSIFNRIRRRIKHICHKCCGSGSGTGSTDYEGIKLVRERDEVIGTGFHRSGWPYVFQYLESIACKDGILLDDFVEQNFCYKDKPDVYREPWVGIFHHPPTIPYFGNIREDLSVMMEKPEFKESAKNLKLAIALSEHLATFLRQHLTCPVVVMSHPAYIPDNKWTHKKYINNRNKKLVQVGYYLRNTQLIRQIPHSIFQKVRLWVKKDWVQSYDARVAKHWKLIGGRAEYNDYKDIYYVPSSKYDDLLCENIVIMEVFDASASNGVLDCLVRNTPIIVNKHPAVVEYLGPNYPLYFTHPDEIPALTLKAKEAHEYLVNLDKSFLNVECFIKKIMDEIQKI